MATLVKIDSGTWKAIIRKAGWPTTAKTFRIKRTQRIGRAAAKTRWCAEPTSKEPR